jgi:hypothetical protein
MILIAISMLMVVAHHTQIMILTYVITVTGTIVFDYWYMNKKMGGK